VLVAPPGVIAQLKHSMSKPTAKVVVKELDKDLTKVPYHELTGTTLMRSLPQRRKLSGGVRVDVLLLSVMDANERLDRFVIGLTRLSSTKVQTPRECNYGEPRLGSRLRQIFESLRWRATRRRVG
jgi:hypothetical protein